MKLDVRIHGRGGQGVVTAAELLSMAAFDQGLHAQALPSFGSERTGAPVMASCRISDHAIRSHDPVSHPDILVVQDLDPAARPAPSSPACRMTAPWWSTPTATWPISSREGWSLGPAQLWVTVPANDLSRELLGRPLPNTALVGAVAGITGLLGPEAVASAIRRRFAGAGQGRRRREHPAGRGRSSRS